MKKVKNEEEVQNGKWKQNYNYLFIYYYFVYENKIKKLELVELFQVFS